MANNQERPQATVDEEGQDVFNAGSEPDDTPSQQQQDGGGEREDLKQLSDAIHATQRTPRQTSVPVVKPASQQPPQPTPQPDKPTGDMVPLAILLEERSARQRAESEAAQFRQQQQKPQEQAAFDPERIFTEPQAIIDHMNTLRANEMRALRLEMNLHVGQARHGEAFDAAWAEFMKQAGGPANGGGVNPQLAKRILQDAADPTAELMAWHQQNQLLATYGTDPNAYNKKVREQLMHDPAFLNELAKVHGLNVQFEDGGQQQQEQPSLVASPEPRRPAAVVNRDPATGQFTSAPRQPTRLPTSLSRIRGATPAGHADDDEDGSEEAIWNAGRNRRS